MKREDGEVWKTLPFTVDFPAIYCELFDNNAEILGPGILMGLRTVLLGLKRISQLAIEEGNTEILTVLSNLGVVDLEGE